MSVPKGRNCKLEIAATYSTALTLTGITLANPGVCANSTPPTTKTIGYMTITGGMPEIDGMAVSAGTIVASTSFTAEGIDTTAFTAFTAGTWTPVATWTTLSQMTSYSIGGGDADEIDVSTLLDTAHQIDFGLLGAETVSFDHLNDMQATGLAAIVAAARAGTSMTFRITLSNGERRVFRGVCSLPGESQGISQAATGSFKVAVKGRVHRLPV